MLAGATIQNRATEPPPHRTARCHALANGRPRSVLRLFAHRSIASCDINVLPFTTHVNWAHAPLPTPDSALEPEVIFCVQGVIGPPCGVPSSTGRTKPSSITPALRN